MNETVIDVSHLSRRFGDQTAVADVSFQVRRGAIFGLLGPNGSGKSTIMRMLLGILPPSAGSASMLGYDCFEQAEQIKPRVGYMSQKFSLYADLSVRENLEFYGRVYGLDRNRLDKRMSDVLEMTSMRDRIGQLAGTLSGGWQRRLGLACALIHEPNVLFLDEPTAGIDPVARRHLWDLLFQLSGSGVTLFVTTHYMDEAERCTDVGYIYLSKLLVLGKPEELKRLPAVTPPNTRRFELCVSNASERLPVLRSLDGIRDATLFGDRIHLLLSEGLKDEQVISALSETSATTELRQIPPSLEDVFVTLTADAEKRSQRNSTDNSLANPPVAAPESNDKRSGDNLGATRPNSLKSQGQSWLNRLSSRGRSTFGLWAVMIKEFVHIRRQPSTLFFMLVVPVMQTIIFGYAIQTQIEHIPTVLFDLDGRKNARELVAAMENTRRFTIVDRALNDESFHRAIRSGRAKVGIRIPPHYSDGLLRGEQVQVQVLVDGSDSQVATTAQSTAQLLGLSMSISLAKGKAESLQVAAARDASGHPDLPIQTRTRFLFNPDLESAHFFVPGLVGIILQLVTLFLTSFAIVRERELGTLEQLFVTPVGRMGLLLGKLLPYALLGFVEVLVILCVMIYVFGVQINGSLVLLLAMSMLFMVCSLSLGLLVSTVAKSQLAAVQLAFVIMLPSVLLSGFMFPRSEMPLPIYLVTFSIPVTYFIEILRGIVLRGADAIDLVSSIIGLALCGFVVLTLSVARFHKRLAAG